MSVDRSTIFRPVGEPSVFLSAKSGDVVIVWDDPINLMSYVTFVFRKVFGYSKDKAEQLMMQVHVEGRAIVSSGSREKAELDVFRLHEHGLWATLEQGQ